MARPKKAENEVIDQGTKRIVTRDVTLTISEQEQLEAARSMAQAHIDRQKIVAEKASFNSDKNKAIREIDQRIAQWAKAVHEGKAVKKVEVEEEVRPSENRVITRHQGVVVEEREITDKDRQLSSPALTIAPSGPEEDLDDDAESATAH